MVNLQCFVAPAVPEVSLIFEKPTVRNVNYESINSSPARSARSTRASDNTMEITNSVSRNPSSYAAWKEQNYSREISSTDTTRVLPLCNDAYNYKYTLPSDLQNASVQKRQEQARSNDKQERLQNTNKNNRIYEKNVRFKCSNREDSHDLENQAYSSSEKRHLPSDPLLKTTPRVIDHIVGISSDTVSDTLKKPEHFQTSHSEYQQFCLPSYSNFNVDNNEMVKTLLQLVNSQNEQIKSLQFQIDRLIRLQEENFRNKSVCLCSQPLANQFRYPINCYDTALASSVTQSQNRGIRKNVASQNTSSVEKQDLENLGENNNKLETALLEQQSTKTFMEQKVSIGVMTSFEFTMQNSPFLIDSEICEQKDTHKESNNINRTNTINIHDTTEPVNRYKNTFMRKPGTVQLENIVEDSESYLSSSQQPSSNFNMSSSVKESSKTYQQYLSDLVQEETPKEIYVEKDDNMDKRMENAKRMSNTSVNIECGPIENVNCIKLLNEQTNDYVMTDKRKNYKTNIDKHSLCDMHLPATDYYYNHRDKDYSANVRQIKDTDDSMTLNGSDLKILERPPPTPEPSIHVEMQEYSDDESDKLRHSSKIGWTFYNKILKQVNEILENSGVIDDKNLNHAKTAYNVGQENDTETRTASNNVKAITLEQLRRLGISVTENENRESNGNKTYVYLYFEIK